MNLKIKHAVVGPFLGDQVVPVSAVEGGTAECERLIALGAAEWTEAEPNVSHPAAKSAVLEMDDDELVKENGRLKAELEAAKAKTEADTAAAVESAVSKARAEAEAEVLRLRAELEKATADPPADGKKAKK